MPTLEELTPWPDGIGYDCRDLSNEAICVRASRVRPGHLSLMTPLGVYDVMVDAEQVEWTIRRFEDESAREKHWVRVQLPDGRTMRILWKSILGIVIEE